MEGVSSHKDGDFRTKNHTRCGEEYQSPFVAPFDRGLIERTLRHGQQMAESKGG